MKSILFASLLTVLSSTAWAASLEVTVTEVRSDKGRVLVALCSRGKFLADHCEYEQGVPARAGSVVVRLDNVPPGVWAAQAYQDEDGNGEVTRNFLGLPTEGIGFSRDAPFRFGPPRFDDAAIQLGPQGGRISLKLRYF